MKRILIFIAAFCSIVPGVEMSAQQRTEEEYSTRYSLLNGRVGPAGLGMETLITNWESDFPDSRAMLLAKFSLYFTKSQTSQVVKKDQPKFMGATPIISLTDSLTGKQNNYFEEIMYDDETFGLATQAIDKAVKLYPLDLSLRLSKVSSLISYEKEYPDMAKAYISSLVDYNATNHPQWESDSAMLSEEDFLNLIQEYCFIFFKIGSPSSMEAFKTLSEKLSSLYPKKAEFLSNIGSYYLVSKSDYKTALKYYTKALKVNPDDYSSIKNCVLLARKTKDVKLEKKYLPMLERVSTDLTEKAAAKARLQAL